MFLSLRKFQQNNLLFSILILNCFDILKFRFMLQKLYSTVHGESEVDNLDTPMNQEILLPGQLYLSIFKEKLQDWLYGIRRSMDKLYRPDQSIDGNFFSFLNHHFSFFFTKLFL